MAYVRRHGNQLAIVHGERESGTGKVQQRVLLPIYSKKEALDILGEGREGADAYFRGLMEEQYPGIPLPWKRLYRAIRENLAALPDTYDYPATRLRGRFREDLCAITRQLAQTDPQELATAAEAIQQHRYELEWIADQIKWRLRHRGGLKNEWTADNEYCWRFVLRGHGVPPDTEEQAAELYEKGDLDRAEAVFRLLTDAFDDYAEGHNYLGLIALARGKAEDAASHFRKTAEVGRRLFPKRIAKRSYWNDISTRPYMRGLQNLGLALNQAGRYEEALAVCERLEAECGGDISAGSHRASAYLNTGRWEEAVRESTRLREIDPSSSLVAALALFELGRREAAAAAFLHGVLNNPRTVRIVLGERSPEPTDAHEAEDHNLGVYMHRTLGGFLQRQGKGSREFFRKLMRSAAVAALEKELAGAERRWREDRKGSDRAPFEKMHRMKSTEFANAEAARLAGPSMMIVDRGGSHGANGKVQR